MNDFDMREVHRYLRNNGFEIIGQKYDEEKDDLFLNLETRDREKYRYCGYLNNLVHEFETESINKIEFLTKPYDYHAIYNMNRWLERYNKLIIIYDFNNYTDIDQPLQAYCVFCRENFLISWNEILHKKKCPYSHGGFSSIPTDKNRFSILSPQIAEEWSDKNEKRPENLTNSSSYRAVWKCKKCGNDWVATVNSRVYSNTGCPRCNEPHGEKGIEYWLNTKNINFEPQKRFPGCVYKNPLRYDFYLPDYNLCIEFHGKQHYEPIEYFGGQKVFEKYQIRDKIKEDYCKQNNIDLLIIPYWEQENINSILTEKICSF